MDKYKGFPNALDIPDRMLYATLRAFAVYIAKSGILYGTRENRIAMIRNGGNDPVGG